MKKQPQRPLKMPHGFTGSADAPDGPRGIHTEKVRSAAMRAIYEHELLKEGDYVVAGLSGGPDSVCLFHFLMSIAEPMKLRVTAVHVNHGIRGEEAERDEKFAEFLTRVYHSSYRSYHVNAPETAREKGMTEEEAGRFLRYQSFEQTAEEIADAGIPKERIRIALAHQADDQAETVLLRIIRGTGPDGLAGMAYSRTDRAGFTVIRPLLDIRKEEIRGYCSENGITPVEDSTNSEPVYQRNRIRLEILPRLEELNPNTVEAILRLQRLAAEDREYFAETAEEELTRVTKERTGRQLLLDGHALRELAQPIRRRVLLRGLKEIGLQEDMTYPLMEKTDRLVFNPAPSSRLDLPHGYSASKVYADVRLSGPRPEEPEEDFTDFRVLVIGAESLEDETAKIARRGTWAAFDADEVERRFGPRAEDRIVLRTRLPGDHIAIRNGRKTLQDLFVDRKIPKEDRERIRFAAAGSAVLFIPACRETGNRAFYAAECVVKETSKRVLVIETFF